jgi:hypothetical protein
MSKENDKGLSRMNDESAWDDPAILCNLLGGELRQSRLALVLGAGTSAPFGLPDWKQLTERLLVRTKAVRPADLTDEEVAEHIWRESFKRSDVDFAVAVRACLYSGVDTSFETLAKHNLLAAIAAVALASGQGRSVRVITFNFDDLLERYLRFLGRDARSIGDLPSWHRAAEVHVYHAHGLLPTDNKTAVSRRGIVFTQESYDRVVGDSKGLWDGVLLDVLRSNTCLFLGLSGKDDNLTRLLSMAKDSHSGRDSHSGKDEWPYWGVRLDRPDCERAFKWNERRVRHLGMSLADIPSFLFKICEAAVQVEA